jgi:hypothetical protein
MTLTRLNAAIDTGTKKKNKKYDPAPGKEEYFKIRAVTPYEYRRQ